MGAALGSIIASIISTHINAIIAAWPRDQAMGIAMAASVIAADMSMPAPNST
ncbi:hypothetical protein GCM10011504_52510 [Siccirubricoccus deserti]|nr:hypothetical protein GCM10011504_52510 [Siccirubricoccus deserti]